MGLVTAKSQETGANVLTMSVVLNLFKFPCANISRIACSIGINSRKSKKVIVQLTLYMMSIPVSSAKLESGQYIALI